jgi:FRG domain
MNYKSEVIKSAGEREFDAKSFLEYLRPSNEAWLSTAKVQRHEWVFRGHADETWKLVPQIGRTNDRKLVKSIVAKVRELKKTPTWQSSCKNEKRIAATIFLYAALMRKFLSISYDVGAWDNSPGEDPFWSGMPWMFADFDAKSFQWNGQSISPLTHEMLEEGMSKLSKALQFPSNKSAAAALAQHHRIPTFLLDWSDDPLVAAYFASQDECPEKDMCVWAFDVSHLGGIYNHPPIGVNRPPKSSNKFLRAQSGLLTYLRDDYHLWKQEGTYPCMEAIIQKCNETNRSGTLVMQTSEDDNRTPDQIWDQDHGCILLRKIVLKKQHIEPLREMLRHERISKEYLMPSFDNIADEAKRACL